LSDSFLPPGLPADRLAVRIGLISDTHLPDRLHALPPVLPTIFEGCDLLLHAGDVGELRVLDELGRIAPLVAVHGNDDTAEAQRELPEQQVISSSRRRILLWHSHDPDPAAERSLRQADAWPPVLARLRRRAQRAGATIAVFGHTHVPLLHEAGGVLLVNPGALASGNAFIRQRLQSVALLFVRDDGATAVRHVDLSAPNQVYRPEVDWQASFSSAHDRLTAPILTPELAPLAEALRSGRFAEPGAVREQYYRLAHRCWAGEQEHITREDVLEEIAGHRGVAAADRQWLYRLLGEGEAPPGN
jgi:uncharacterized protein